MTANAQTPGCEELNRAMTVFASHVYECANEHRGWQPSEEGKLKEAVRTYTQRQVLQSLLEELERQNNHYNLKGGHLLLYEQDGENVYLDERIAQLQQALTALEQTDHE